MPFLRLKAREYQQDEVMIINLPFCFKRGGREVFWIKFSNTATIGYDHDLPSRKTLLGNQVARVGLRNGNVVVDKPPEESVYSEAPLNQSMPPSFAYVRR